MWALNLWGGGVWTNSLNFLTPKSVLELFSMLKKIFHYFLIYKLEKLVTVYMAANGLIGKYVHGDHLIAYFRKTQQL